MACDNHSIAGNAANHVKMKLKGSGSCIEIKQKNRLININATDDEDKKRKPLLEQEVKLIPPTGR